MSSTSSAALTWQERNQKIADGRIDAYATANLLDGNGDINKTGFRVRITEVLMGREVADSMEKATKAFHQGSLTAAIFPTTPGAKDADVLDDIETAVWNQLRRDVWTEVDPDAGSGVQQNVGKSKDGALLVKTTKQDGILVQGTITIAAYVTTDDDLLLQDFEAPLKESVRRAQARLSRNMLMLGQRKPEIAARVRQDAIDVIEDAGASVRTAVGQLGTGKAPKSKSAPAPTAADE